MRRSIAFISTVLVLGAAHGQGGLAPGTSIQVEPGTTLRFAGPQVFSVPSGSSVVNDGTIVFEAPATLSEALGAPVTGLGTEVITVFHGAPLAGEEPAGLGLTLSTDVAPGTLTVERGHLPAIDNGGLQSIARWYDVDVTTNSGLNSTVALRYDPLELNGAIENDLLLHTAGAGNLWWYAASTVDLPGHTVTATGLDSLGTLTLFDAISTGTTEAARSRATVLCMDVAGEWIEVRHAGNAPLGHIRIHDTQGRLVWRGFAATSAQRITIEPWSPAVYRLSVGAEQFGFVKP